MKNPISYYGGKQRIADKIVQLIPKHTVYVEPFAGGAAVFFAKPWPKLKNGAQYREVINDKDKSLINFYRVLRDNGPELIERLLLTPYSRSEYKDAKDLSVTEDIVESARKYFTNINQSFAKKINGGWGRSVYGKNDALSYFNKIGCLQQFLDRMSGTYIECDDALNVIKNWDSPQTFFYCDPPYPNTSQGHYGGYTVHDLQLLVNALDNCQGSFILSNYEQVNVKFPSDWERYEIPTFSSVNGRVRYNKADAIQKNGRTEIIWRRKNKIEPRQEILDLYNSDAFSEFK